MQLERPLSSLELTALGIILKRGPCLAHAVVAEFANSQTFAYRSGAGSVYPLLKRLEAAGLLARDGKRYILSAEGREALTEWVKPPFPDAAFSTNLDVLRSRVYFMKLLRPDEIAEFVKEATKKLKHLLKECEARRLAYEEAGDRFSEAAMSGAVKETEARIAWISELGEKFGQV